jgi:hypothetical protein
MSLSEAVNAVATPTQSIAPAQAVLVNHYDGAASLPPQCSRPRRRLQARCADTVPR